MDHDNERPAKRVRLELTSNLEGCDNSSIHEGRQDQRSKYSNQDYLLSDECQPEYPPISLSSQVDEKSSSLKNEQLEDLETSPAPSNAICSQDAGCLTRSQDLVCFGSITGLSVSRVDKLLHQATLKVGDVGQLYLPDQTTCGSLLKRDIRVLDLLKKEGIESDLLWTPASRAVSDQLGTLWLTIYGARELASDIGDTLQEAEIFLQDPIHAERNTLYWNPQRFQNTEGLYTASLMRDAPVESHPEICQFEAIDVLKEFTSEDNLPETEGSASLCIMLESHQKRGLTFMLRRECGWQLDTRNGDVWSRTKDEAGNMAYLNNINNSLDSEHPVPFHGGIIADDMGLGKTLSMIALIAHNRPINPEARQKQTTLIVMPPSLLSTWETELRERTSPGHLSWLLYHGPSRVTRCHSFADFDIVLTTYSTMAREWSAKGGRTSIFTHQWHRLILDEAHVIKNSASATAQAACALNAKCRWTVTATPIQNRLAELFSLLRFLRLYQNDEQKGLAMESDDPEQGIERLKALLKFIMLRRHKDILHLPKRTDVVVPLEFEDQDQAKYDQSKRATIRYLDDMINSETASNGYMNAISKINALRMVCNNGCSTDVRHAQSNASPSDSSSEAPLVVSRYSMDQLLNPDDLTEATSNCTICGVLILTSPSPEPENHIPQRTASMAPTGLRMSKGAKQCRSCFSDSIGALDSFQEEVSMRKPGPQFPWDDKPQEDRKPSGLFSTKVKALVSDLRTQRQARKSIVFSFWKSTLDLASSALQQAGFTCLQVDGDVPAGQRGAILQRFSELDTEAVLLMSLSCGAVGLNLTAASRAYLMEPQWNPAIEEQALARVYRLGQTKPVVTVRFFVKESIEEYVRQVQEAKQELVDMLLSSKSSEGNSKVTELRRVLS